MLRAQAAARAPQPVARAPRGGPRPVTSAPAALWVRAIRVRQWPKNLLLFAAPAAAGALTRPGVLTHVALAAVAFCLLSSGAYLLNDLRDAPEDRRHPVKRHRPVASRAISARAAFGVSALLLLAGLSLATALGVADLAMAVAYVVLNFAYTACLREVAVLDIAAVAGAFVIRAAAGGVAAHVPISRWLFVVVSFAALFVAAGKRYADFQDPAARASRRVLREYNADFLRLVIGVASAVALGAYCLWAFGPSRPGLIGWRELTVVPFTVALLRYGLLVTGGRGGAPEEVLLGDRFMQVTGVVWLAMFGLGL